MNHKRYSLFSVLILILLLTSSMHAAVSGKITGVVQDKSTGETLPGANLAIQGTSLGASSDLDGEFFISRVPLGKYTLIATYIGYESQSIDVELKADKADAVLKIEMIATSLEGEEVVVTAQAVGQQQAINEQLTARSIKNVVSREQIQEVPDANAAESVGRLPGVSINRSGGEGSTVTVRGLAPRFNLVQVDGVNMGSIDQNSRATNISGISPNILDGIEVTKALTADMDANSLGGTVNLKLKTASENEYHEILAQGGYNNQEEDWGNYKFVGVYSNRFFNKKFGFLASANTERVNRGSDILNSDWRFNLNSAIPDTITPDRFTYLDRKETRTRYGANIVLDYAFSSGVLKLTSFFSRLDRDIESYSQRINPLGGWDWGFNQSQGGDDFTDISVTNLSGEFNVLGGTLDFGAAHSYTQRTRPNVISMGGWSQGGLSVDLDDSVPAHLWYNQVEIPYDDLGFGGVSFDSYDTQDRAYTYKLNYDYPFNFGFTAGSIKIGGLAKHKTRDYRRGNVSGSVSGNDELIAWMKADMADVFTRDAQTNNFPIDQAFDDHWDNDKFFDGIYTAMLPFISNENFDRLAQSTKSYYDAHPDASWNTGIDKYRDQQSGWEDSYSAYINPTFNFLKNSLTFIPGVRYEKVEYRYSGNNVIVPFSGRLEEDMFNGMVSDTSAYSYNEHILPMIHLRYKPANWFDVRLAYTQTLSRPGYQSLVPYFYQDPNSYEAGGGNIDLKPQVSTNYDIYTSFYSNELGLLTIGGFYKEIDDLIWNTDIAIATDDDELAYGLNPVYNISKFTTPINNKYKGYVGGLEVDFQTNFWYLPRPLNGLVFRLNYTYINSETKYPRSYSKLIQKRPPISTRVDTTYSAPLEGQPEHVVNAALGYDYKGFSIRVSYLFQQGMLNQRNWTTVLSRYLEDFSRWDIMVRQKLPVEGLEAYMNFNNINESGDQFYRYDPMYISNREYYGMTIDMGLRWRM